MPFPQYFYTFYNVYNHFVIKCSIILSQMARPEIHSNLEFQGKFLLNPICDMTHSDLPFTNFRSGHQP